MADTATKPAEAKSKIATKDADTPPAPRPIAPDEPPFVLSADAGTGWFAYSCAAPAVRDDVEAPPAPTPPVPQPAVSDTIEGNIEAASADAAKLAIATAYPGARFS